MGSQLNHAVLLIGHGSRNSDANREFEQLVEQVRLRFEGELPIFHGYVELAAPSFVKALSDLSMQYDKITVVPISLFMAGHVKNDIPLAIAKLVSLNPKTKYIVTPALGVEQEMVNLFYDRVTEAIQKDDADAAVIVVGRGSSDPDANSNFFKLVRLIGEGAKLYRVFPCFVGITSPRLAETLDYVARMRPRRVFVIPYFLFTGVLMNRIDAMIREVQEKSPWIKVSMLSYIGVDRHLVDLVERRVREADEQRPNLDCVTCHYRAPLGKLSEQVGGLKSLLWSLRHTITHNQAMPHSHAHTPMKKHVLVCTNNDCADKGALRVLRRLQRTLKDKKVFKDYKVTRTSCMGRCGEGPTVAVYPDGIWYRELDEASAERLVCEHLLNDQLVAEKVDNIMQ